MTKIFKRTSLILALFLILSLLIACGKLFYRQPAIEPLSYSFIYTPPHATPSLPMDVTIGVLEPNTSINFQHNRETMGIKGVATGDEQLKAQLAYNAYWSALEKDEKASQVLSDFYNKIKEDFTEILKPQKSFSYFSQISLAERRDTLIVFSPAIELSIDTVKLTTFEDKGGTTKGVVLRLQEKMSIESKITLTAYEALTEKEILRLDGNTHKSGEESFFSDSLAKSFKYEFIRIVISTYPNVLGKGLSSLYPELMQEQWDTITSEWLQDVVAKARLIREEAVPSFPSPSYRFVYEAPSQKAQTTSIATAIIEFKPLVELQVAGSEPARIAKEFAEAVQKDFSSVLHNRGIQVLQQSLKS
ncbi:MAG: hypothetical protein H8E40_15230, partial [Chloroflexi bacterium]|nr:hypothetical protein [Chloroflexota bacterium]